MGFNQAQLEAIKHQKGPAMILAGPGSGKTTVITQRIHYLVEQCGIDAGSILVITFTKAAAMEMKRRFEVMNPEKAAAISFGTFHAIFFRILKYAYRFTANNIVREEQRIQFIRELMETNQIDTEDEAEFISGVLAEVSEVKGDMIALEHYYAKTCSEQVFKQIYQGYEGKLRSANLLDFDDMLVLCYQLFTERTDILKAWQKKYQYILIDEFQDINRIQYEMIRMLAAPEDNLFIVGDDDQSIYRFRGAKPEIMLGFERDYGEVKRVLLNINYRSSRDIVVTAGKLIQYNKTRFKKDILPQRGAGKPVITSVWETPQEETKKIIEELSDYHKLGYDWNDIAVLYRTNLGPRLLVERLMEYNIPFRIRESLPNLYNHWVSQNMLAYIRMAQGDLSRQRVLQVINRPNRYVNRDSLDTAVVSWEAIKSFYQDKSWMVERIERLEYDLKMLGKMAPAAAVNYIRKAVGYDLYLKEYAQSRSMKAEDLLEILDQLQESAAEYRTMPEWFSHMEEYEKRLREQGARRETEVDGIALMTMHSAKGLEYRVVYILDANEGITPHQKAVLDVDLEEERRMFYVAMTRAKERLHVYFVKERYGKIQSPSRFIKEYGGVCQKGN